MKKVIVSPNAPEAIGVYSQAIESNGMLYVSGQLPINPETNAIVSNDFKEQAHQVLKNIQAIVEEANYKMSDIVKCTCYMSDIANLAAFNTVYSEYFSCNYPARVVIAVKDIPLGAMLEMDAIGIVHEMIG